jgi:hypothetical protein
MNRTTNFRRAGLIIVSVGALVALGAGCASAPPVKAEAYAQLKNHRTFENDFTAVWKGIEETFRKFKVTDRDPSEVGELALRKLDRRTLKTDWSYGQSRDKYEEYQVNGTPRKVWLQERTRYNVDARRVIGGVEVAVTTDEEVERIKSDGSSGGFQGVDKIDSSRAAEILDKIANNILAAPPSNAP